MVQRQISAKIDLADAEFKAKQHLSYRYIIAKGKEHIEICLPRAQIMAENYKNMVHARNGTRLMHWLREKHPKTWDEFVTDGGWTT